MLIKSVLCGQSFNTKKLDRLSFNSNGSMGVQHSPGYGNISTVHYNRGNITRIILQKFNL